MRIRAAMAKGFAFSALIEEELEKVVDALKEVKFEPGQDVIVQGDLVMPDDLGLYVLESGELEVFKYKESQQPPGPKVHEYKTKGDSFGDLALLYSQPRAATVRAKTAAVCYALPRRAYNVFVRGAVEKRREKYDMLIEKVDIFKHLPKNDLGRISDVIKYQPMKEEDIICKEGEEGDVFFILESGNAVAKVGDKVVKEYSETDYFGELALLQGSSGKRRATVVCTESGGLLCIDRASFKRLLDPIEQHFSTRAKTVYGIDLNAQK